MNFAISSASSVSIGSTGLSLTDLSDDGSTGLSDDVFMDLSDDGSTILSDDGLAGFSDEDSTGLSEGDFTDWSTCLSDNSTEETSAGVFGESAVFSSFKSSEVLAL